MNILPMRGSTAKSAESRQKLLEAAVTCLWKHGYAGTTLSSVAKEAGFSRGPQQYYFPTRVDLMVGVWDYLSKNLENEYRSVFDPDLTVPERLRAAIEVSITRAGTKQYVAELELKLATRGDAALADVLVDLINEREDRADRVWASGFKNSGKSETDILVDRYVLVGMIHGLAIERISGRPQALLSRMEDELREMADRLILKNTAS